MRRNCLALSLASLALPLSIGCSTGNLACGPGTVRKDDLCVPQCGPGASLDGGTCVPATSGVGGDANGSSANSGGSGPGTATSASAASGGTTSATTSGSTATSSGGGGTSGLTALLPKATFDALFLHRGTAPCKGAFYTYEALLAAAEQYPDFVGTGSDDDRKRELAAFLANIGHETTGGWPAAPDGPYSWGLCWVTEGGAVAPGLLPEYCAPSAEWPCAPGKKYFGRGPIQLSWNANYGQAGAALGIDLLNEPDKVASDPGLAFKTALWFWMTPQAPKPSCHDIMTGGWVPTAADVAAGRVAGFGMTINVINGGLECGVPSVPNVLDRIGYFEHFASILGVDPGPHLTCDKMQHY